MSRPASKTVNTARYIPDVRSRRVERVVWSRVEHDSVASLRNVRISAGLRQAARCFHESNGDISRSRKSIWISYRALEQNPAGDRISKTNRWHGNAACWQSKFSRAMLSWSSARYRSIPVNSLLVFVDLLRRTRHGTPSAAGG